MSQIGAFPGHRLQGQGKSNDIIAVHRPDRANMLKQNFIEGNAKIGHEQEESAKFEPLHCHRRRVRCRQEYVHA